ncbi:6042_t:CDS:2, partial [Cetraspora pellucida]
YKISFERLSENINLDVEMINLNVETIYLDAETSFNIDIDKSQVNNSFDLLNEINNSYITLHKEPIVSISDNQVMILVGQTFADWNNIVICWTKDKYCIRHTHLEHNYPMDTAIVVFDSSYWKLSHNKNAHIQMLYDSGIPVPTITAELLNNLNTNNEYRVTYLVNNKKLHCLFFTIRIALSTFNYYPEILLLDSTYKTNNSEFCWAFHQLKEIIEDKMFYNIRTIVIDSDSALISAVRTEMSHAKHQLCDCLLDKYPEAYSYMVEQWKPYKATNVHLKRLLGHMTPLPDIHQQCPEFLKEVSIIISDFVYALLLEQYTMINNYDIKKQEAGLLHVYYNEHHEHTIYQVNNSYICFCDYNTQFALPCRHVLAVHVINKKSLNVDYIGLCWIITSVRFTVSEKQSNNFINNNEFTTMSNHIIHDISSDKQKSTKNTIDLIKDIESISNRVGHIEINNTVALFVEQLKNKYPLSQDDIRDPIIAKTKGRPSNTKRKKIGAEHATKKLYVCSICSNNGHNSRSCPSKSK